MSEQQTKVAFGTVKKNIKQLPYNKLSDLSKFIDDLIKDGKKQHIKEAAEDIKQMLAAKGLIPSDVYPTKAKKPKQKEQKLESENAFEIDGKYIDKKGMIYSKESGRRSGEFKSAHKAWVAEDPDNRTEGDYEPHRIKK